MSRSSTRPTRPAARASTSTTRPRPAGASPATTRAPRTCSASSSGTTARTPRTSTTSTSGRLPLLRVSRVRRRTSRASRATAPSNAVLVGAVLRRRQPDHELSHHPVHRRERPDADRHGRRPDHAEHHRPRERDHVHVPGRCDQQRRDGRRFRSFDACHATPGTRTSSSPTASSPEACPRGTACSVTGRQPSSQARPTPVLSGSGSRTARSSSRLWPKASRLRSSTAPRPSGCGSARVAGSSPWRRLATARAPPICGISTTTAGQHRSTLYPYTGSGSTEIGTGANSVPVETWAQVEVQYTASATGGARLYLNGQTQANWGVTGDYTRTSNLQRVQLWDDGNMTADFDQVDGRSSARVPRPCRARRPT